MGNTRAPSFETHSIKRLAMPEELLGLWSDYCQSVCNPESNLQRIYLLTPVL
jgi:hypothetical protein